MGPFDQQLYRGRIDRLQGQVKRFKDYAKMDFEALAHDRLLYPQKTQNSKGEPLWKGSEAAKWLEIDMKDGLHLMKSPQELRETRECYKQFSKKRFSKRIDQLKQKAKKFGKTPGQFKKGRGEVKVVQTLRRCGSVNRYHNS